MVLVCSACALANGAQQRTTLRVENRNWTDAVVYFFPSPGTEGMRIGRVGSLDTASMRIPIGGDSWFLGVQLSGSPVRWTTEPAAWMVSSNCILLVIKNMLSLTQVMPC